ncbi:MAG: 50S ribosomal protein L18 [Candidatus Woesearchaeota archaeon]
MPHKKLYQPNRRKSKTDYNKRLSLLKSRLPRLVVRVTSRSIVAQIVSYKVTGDVVVGHVTSRHLLGFGWKGTGNNISAAYLIGYLLGMKVKKDVSKVILDIGKRPSVSQSRVYGVVKGCRDAGLDLVADESILPSEDRVTGTHIKTYAEKLKKEDTKKYETYFSKYIAKKFVPETYPEHVNEVKSKIMGAK